MTYRSTLLAAFVAFIGTSSCPAKDYRLPFEGRWFVMQGGDTPNVNHHMKEPSQWFGIDLMKCGGLQNRSIATGSGSKVEDYYSWNQPVLSPVNGIVHVVHDGDADNPIGKTDTKNAFGNYVVIEATPERFVYLAHFKKGTISVKEGQRVKAGRELGKCGNSGNTTGPHIHMHVQSKLKPYTGRGQNITFKGITVLLSGKEFKNVDWPLIRGLFVWQGKDE